MSVRLRVRSTKERLNRRLVKVANRAPVPATCGGRLPREESVAAAATALALDINPPTTLTK